MSDVRMVRFLDYDQGSLLVLTEDFSIESGWSQAVRPDFSWWMMEEKGVVGYSIDGLEKSPPDLDFFRSCDFRVAAPQLRLINAGVDDVVAAAYSLFIQDGCGSHVGKFYGRIFDSLTQVRGSDDLIREFQDWSLLYQVYGHIDGLYWMGNAALRLGMYAESIRWLERFLDLKGDHAWAHCDLGSANFGLGKLAAARRHWETAVCIDRQGDFVTDAATLLETLKR